MKDLNNHSVKSIRSFTDYLSQGTIDSSTKTSSEHEVQDSVLETDDLLAQLDAALQIPSLDQPQVEAELEKPVVEERVAAPTETSAPVQESQQATVTLDPSAYRVVRDRDENFECNIQVEGTSLHEARARIVLECDSWNLMFQGKIFPDGRCVVPLKKGIPLHEGTRGNIRLEIIAEDQLFVGWEDKFVVGASKKVHVELKEQKSVKVSFGKPL